MVDVDLLERRYIDARKHGRRRARAAAAADIACVDEQQPADGKIAVDIGKRRIRQTLR